MAELWKMLISAQESYLPGQKGMPAQLLKEKEEEIVRINQELQERAKKISDEQLRNKEKNKEKEKERDMKERTWELQRPREVIVQYCFNFGWCSDLKVFFQYFSM
jgi:parvulin-like peptidyl-prolyl isomerase